MVDLNLRRTLFGGNDIAIDLGTANTLIYVKGVGVVVDEPTLLAVNKSDNSIITIGREAKKLIGRVPDTIELVRPLRDGVISEIEMAEELVKTLLSRAIGRAYSRPRIVICVPNGVTSVEQRSIETAAHATGASEVFTIEEPMAAAIGSGLNIFEPYGNMIVDIGGGTTELNGSSVLLIGIPNSSAIFLSICFNRDPPPVSHAPSLSISETKAGGVCERDILIASIISFTTGCKAFLTSLASSNTCLGIPLTISLPVTVT